MSSIVRRKTAPRADHPALQPMRTKRLRLISKSLALPIAATGQPATIRVYKGAQSAEGLIAALRAATQDECDVCCITWGKDEQSWNAADVAAFNDAAKAAVDNGMIIVAASGDNDFSDGGPTPANVDFPASSPYVIGCGGTKLLHPREVQGTNAEVSSSNGVRKSGTTFRARDGHGSGRRLFRTAFNTRLATGNRPSTNANGS